MTTIQLSEPLFSHKERSFLEEDGIAVSLFRYDTGIAAVRISNRHGFVIVLPYMGQMIWDAHFAGRTLTMHNSFDAPRPAKTIAETYGCFAFHSGLLHNGNPGPQDQHLPHGEMPCAVMDRSWLELGQDADGRFVRLHSAVDHIAGFGARYRAQPSLTLRPDATLFDIAMTVENRGAGAMDLMYMCHVNPAFVPDGRIVQPAPWTPDSVVVRTAIPPHIPPTPQYVAQIERLAQTPAALQVLLADLVYDPEQVFYIRRPRADADGLAHFLLRRPQGDGFAIAYDPTVFSHTVRWLMRNVQQSVAAIALPATCEPEGHAAEQRKGNVRSLAPGASASFMVRTGHVDAHAAAALQARIEAL